MSLIVVTSMAAFYVASAKTDGNPNSPWESVLDVLVTGGSVNISSPVVLETGTHVDVSGSTVDVSGPVSLVPGTQVGISGDVSLVDGALVEVIGEVEVSGDVGLVWGTTVGVSGSVALEPGTEVTVTSDTWNQPVFIDEQLPVGDSAYSLIYIVDGYKYVHIAKDSPYHELTVKYIWDMNEDPHITMTTSIDGVTAPGVYTIGVKAPKIFLILKNVSSSPTAECSVVFYAVS